MKRFPFIKTIAGAMLVLAVAVSANAGSTVNPTVPAQNAPMSSAPIRNNFAAAYNDINNIETKFGGTSAPLLPSTRQDWFNTTTSTAWDWQLWDGASWVSIGTLNPVTHVWTAATGGSVTSFSGGTTGLTPNTATTGAVTLGGTLAVANGGTGITSFGTGIATWLGTPSSANLAAALTDKTGSGSAVFSTSPTLVTPVLGVATATSINKVAITAPASSATLTIANGKTLTVNNSIALTGTDSTVMTFPSTSATIARTDTGQTFTGTNIFSNGTTFSSALTYGGVTLSNAVTGTGNMVLSASPTFTGTATAAGLTLSSTLTTNVTGSIQCLQANSSGVVSGTGAACATVTQNSAVLRNTSYATTSGGVMAGFGSTLAVTTTTTGNVRLTCTGDYSQGSVGAIQFVPRYGTGAAPASGAALTGTRVQTSPLTSYQAVASQFQTYGLTYNLSLSASTAYWFDMEVAAGAGSLNFRVGECYVTTF